MQFLVSYSNRGRIVTNIIKHCCNFDLIILCVFTSRVSSTLLKADKTDAGQSSHIQIQAPRKHFAWTSPFEIGQVLILQNLQGFTSRQTLILVSLLSFKNSNPRRNVELNMRLIKCKQLHHFTLYDALINKSE